MSSSNFPTDPDLIFVADASVVINLNASGCAHRIISAFSQRFTVTDVAANELRLGAQKGYKDAEKLDQLIDAGAIGQVSLSEIHSEVYQSLIQGSTLHTLDDGEAATIAYASQIAGVALIDERKATVICQNHFPKTLLLSTVDILLASEVANALGSHGQADAIANALKHARMRVPPEQMEAVINVIGADRAGACSSLPVARRRTRP